jgi:hypothetical protein
MKHKLLTNSDLFIAFFMINRVVTTVSQMRDWASSLRYTQGKHQLRYQILYGTEEQSGILIDFFCEKNPVL